MTRARRTSQRLRLLILEDGPIEDVIVLIPLTNKQVPEKLSKEQREKLVEFGQSCGEKDLSAEEGFMGKAKRFFEGEN